MRFSNHPGHGRFRGRPTPPEEAEDIILGLAEAGVLASAAGVLSGYLGSAGIGQVLSRLIRRVRHGNPAARVCLDPVMGDRRHGLYVADDLVDFFCSEALALADILTPNYFELEVLAGRRLPCPADVVDAARHLTRSGPKTVVVTSVVTPDAAPQVIATIAVERAAVWQVTTPWLDHAACGAGDLLAALYFAHHLAGRPTPDALARAVSSVFAVIAATVAAGARELQLVAAQDALLQPPALYPSVRIG